MKGLVGLTKAFVFHLKAKGKSPFCKRKESLEESKQISVMIGRVFSNVPFSCYVEKGLRRSKIL